MNPETRSLTARKTSDSQELKTKERKQLLVTSLLFSWQVLGCWWKLGQAKERRTKERCPKFHFYLSPTVISTAKRLGAGLFWFIFLGRKERPAVERSWSSCNVERLTMKLLTSSFIILWSQPASLETVHQRFTRLLSFVY